MLSRCKHCGKIVSDASKECKFCGSENENFIPVGDYEKRAKERKKAYDSYENKITVITICVVVVLIFLGALIAILEVDTPDATLGFVLFFWISAILFAILFPRITCSIKKNELYEKDKINEEAYKNLIEEYIKQ